MRWQREGKNPAELILRHTAESSGFASLERAEAAREKRGRSYLIVSSIRSRNEEEPLTRRNGAPGASSSPWVCTQGSSAIAHQFGPGILDERRHQRGIRLQVELQADHPAAVVGEGLIGATRRRRDVGGARRDGEGVAVPVEGGELGPGSRRTPGRSRRA